MRNGQKRDRARELRRDMTLAEHRLWSILRQRQLDGFRFRRQHPIGPYIADFACLEMGLIIEADGGQHMDAATDAARSAFLRNKGFEVLRFWNNEIMTNLEGVRARISSRLADACPHPNLHPQAEEGADLEG
jgi:very-short-patch-repair endonuclease